MSEQKCSREVIGKCGGASRTTYAVFLPRDGGQAHARVSYNWGEASGFAKGVPGAHVRKFSREEAARSWLQYMHGADAKGPVPQSVASAVALRIERQHAAPRARVETMSSQLKEDRVCKRTKSGKGLASKAREDDFTSTSARRTDGAATMNVESATEGSKRRRTRGASSARGGGSRAAHSDDGGSEDIVLLTVSTDGACKMRAGAGVAAANTSEAQLSAPCRGNRERSSVASWAVVWHDLDERARELLNGQGPSGGAACDDVLQTRAALLTDREDHTNQRAELRAFVQALRDARDLQQRCSPVIRIRLRVRTDSMWTINGYSDWMGRWKKNGWRRADGGAVKHQDLWKEADELGAALRGGVEMLHVRGHRGDYHNEMADALAARAITAFDSGQSRRSR